MFGRGWRLGTIGGIAVRVDSSWLWIAIIVTYSFYLRFAHTFLGVSEGEAIGFAVLSSLLYFGSVLVHEMAHAGIARALRIPVSGVTLVFWGGFTEVHAERRGPAADFLVSAAGPASTLVLAGVYWLLALATAGSVLGGVFGYLGWLNLMLAGLNALPGFPLDGGRALRAIVWRVTGNRRRASEIAGWVGVAVGLAIGAVGLARASAGDMGYGLWLLFIAMILVQAARQMRGQEDLRERLAAGTAGEAADSSPPAVDAGLSLSEALDRHLRGNEAGRFPVVDGGRLVGVLTFESARRVGMRDPLRRVREAMLPLDEATTIRAEVPLDEAVERLRPGGSLLVVRDGAVTGVLTLPGVARWAGSAERAADGSPPLPPPPPA